MWKKGKAVALPFVVYRLILTENYRISTKTILSGCKQKNARLIAERPLVACHPEAPHD
jgi:hypothetical protein